jgi:hypothetical protein
MILALINIFHKHVNNIAITSKTCTLAMFLIVDFETIFNTAFVAMWMLYLHIKFHMPNSSGSLVIDIRPKPKYTHTFCSAAIYLSYLLQKTIIL